MLLLEFTVLGPPLSHQTHNRSRLQRWRDDVAAAARHEWPAGKPLLSGRLRVTIMYFHDGEAVRIDNDNLVKPILDALNGVVYRDDSLIVETHVSKKPIDGAYRVRHISPVLAHAFHIGSEFLYIQIEEFVEAGELLP